MKKYIFITIVIAAMLSACTTEDAQMDRTIFIPDQNDSQLPAYTEWGYNAFGAKIDRKYFLASNSILPCKVLYKDGSLRFSLSGIYNSYNYGGETTLIFEFPLERIAEYSGLLILNDKNMELLSPEIHVIMNNDTLNVVDGTLNFRRAQMLKIDDEPNRVILSGVFNFHYLDGVNPFPVNVSEGRFDMGINRDNFYAY
jgi:hypothetical protein